jgi:Flp pilus assembly protein TadG
VVADKAQMTAGIRRKTFCESARQPAPLADATRLAVVCRKAAGRLRREDGQALVEFAIVMPVLLIIVTGIIQFGLLFNKYITLTDAARNGAQTLAIGRGLSNPCDPAVLQTVQSGSATGLTASQVTPSFSSGSDFCGTGTYTYNTTGNTNGAEIQGDQATVTATQPFTLSVFGMSVVQMNLSASASDAIQ